MHEHIGLAFKALPYRLNYCQEFRDFILLGDLLKIIVLCWKYNNLTQLDLVGACLLRYKSKCLLWVW